MKKLPIEKIRKELKEALINYLEEDTWNQIYFDILDSYIHEDLYEDLGDIDDLIIKRDTKQVAEFMFPKYLKNKKNTKKSKS